MATELTVEQALSRAKHSLQEVTDFPMLDASILLCYILNKEAIFLKAYPEHKLTSEQYKKYYSIIEQRCLGIPVAYLIGQQSFWDIELRVNEHTLIPRPDTETLVEKALELIPVDKPIMVLDLGVGSGAIALAIAKHRTKAFVVGVDLSHSALLVAQANAISLGITNVAFCNSSWLDSFKKEHIFDVIVSNPPYLAAEDPYLAGDIKYEPMQALVSGDTGLECFKIITTDARSYLKPNGALILEHGIDQQVEITTMCKSLGYENVHGRKDLPGKCRIVIAFSPNR